MANLKSSRICRYNSPTVLISSLTLIVQVGGLRVVSLTMITKKKLVMCLRIIYKRLKNQNETFSRCQSR